MCLADELRSLLPDDLSPRLIFAVWPPSFSDITLEATDFYRVDPADVIYDDKRDAKHAMVRQIICYLARRLTRLSHDEIASRLGYVQRSTVAYHTRRVERLAQHDELLTDDIDILKRRILDRLLRRFEGGPCH